MRKNFLLRFAVLAVCTFVLTGTDFILQPSLVYAAEPNIIIIQADNLGWGDLCANLTKTLDKNFELCKSALVNTQNLDSLSRGGVTMTNFHAATPSCSPSRTSLMTGMSARRHGVLNNNGNGLTFPTTLPTVANLLQSKYNTVFIGKWHLGGAEDSTPEKDCTSPESDCTLPAARGFKYYYVSAYGAEQYGLCFRESNPDGTILDQDNFFITHNYLGANVPEPCTGDPETVWWQFVKTTGPANELRTKSMSEVLTDKAIEYINAVYGKDEKPFFLYLNYYANHGPLDIDIADVPFDSSSWGSISYQQYKARYFGMTDLYDDWFDPNLTGYRTLACPTQPGSGLFSVGNYIYSGPSWITATARGQITYVGGTAEAPVISYKLVSTRSTSISDFYLQTSIREYGCQYDESGKCTMVDLDGICTAGATAAAGPGAAPSYYNQAIKELDNGVGRILEKLTALGPEVENNTIVIFLSDNGANMGANLEYWNDPSMLRKSTGGLRGGYPYLYEGGARIPFIAKWPAGGWGADGNPLSTVFSDQLADITDILPTLLKAAGVKLPNTPIDGSDISAVLQDSTGSTVRQKKNVHYNNFDARRYYGPSSSSADIESFPYAIWSYDPVYDPNYNPNYNPQNDPDNVNAMNSMKLFLDFDYTQKELYLLADVNEAVYVEYDNNLVELPSKNAIKAYSTDTDPDAIDPKVETLQQNSIKFLDSIGKTTNFPPFENVNINSCDKNGYDRLFVTARDPNEALTNVRLQFYKNNVYDGTSGVLALLKGESHNYPITILCDGDALLSSPTACTSYNGTIKVFTDKPAYVNIYSAATPPAASVSAGPSRTIVFPRIVSETEKNISITNSAGTNLDVLITAFPSTAIPTDYYQKWGLGAGVPTRIIQKESNKYDYPVPAGFEGRIRIDAVSHDTVTAVYNGEALTVSAQSTNLANARIDIINDPLVVPGATVDLDTILNNDCPISDYDETQKICRPSYVIWPQIKSVDTSGLQGTLINRGSHVQYTAPGSPICDTFYYTIKTEEGDIPQELVGFLENEATVRIKVGDVSCDDQKPTTAVSLTGTMGTNSWYRSKVKVTLTATEAGDAGIKYIEYKLDDQLWKRVDSLTTTPVKTLTTSFDVEGDGSHTVLYRATDNQGNAELGKTSTFKIDTTSPYVDGKNPANGSAGVALKPVITVLYNESVVPGSQYSKISLKKGTTSVSITKSYSQNVLTITPNKSLTSGTYTITVSAGAMNDLAGNTQVVADTFTFTTQ